ncbi:MAG: site-specific DNA-methyltransferase, partial [Proteobacteria bacterium]|nr:site-specific DNA-methyltransferase [Pseudomonadota bacterium]
MNTLYYGDNLDILRRYIADESVDLIYLDPPFNSKATYNVLFAEKNGSESASQIKAFDDTWHWDEAAARAYQEVVEAGGMVSQAMQAFRQLLGENDMLAYLAMMAPRLVELRRVLKPTGTIYLHCDPTASHYLKILLDSVFGSRNFINEISWKRTSSKSDYAQGATHWPRIRDIIFFYRKDSSKKGIFKTLFGAHHETYIKSKYPYVDDMGRHYGLWDMTGPGGAAKGNPQYEVMGVTRYWRYSKERMDKLISEGRVIQPKPGAVPRYKRYLDEMPGVVISDN